MRALVIGASGQVGGALLRLLGERGEPVVGTYRSRPMPGLEPLDVTDADAVRELVERSRPQIIYLPAALTAVDYCETHPDEAWRSNVEAPASVARAAAAARAKLVFYSTEYVFDGRAGPYSEDDPINPLGAYARSKAEGERAVQAASSDVLIVRTTVVYGWDPNSVNFAMQVWNRLSAGEAMRVPSDQISNPTLIDFLTEATVQLVDHDVRGIVNVVGRDRVPRSEFAVRLARALGLDERLIEPISTAELQQLAPRPLNAGLRTEKLAGLLGHPAIALDDAIARFAAQQRAGSVAPAT